MIRSHLLLEKRISLHSHEILDVAECRLDYAIIVCDAVELRSSNLRHQEACLGCVVSLRSFRVNLLDFSQRNREIKQGRKDRPSPSSQSHTEPSGRAQVVRELHSCICGNPPRPCLVCDRRRRSSRRGVLVVLPFSLIWNNKFCRFEKFR
jgi:hypothetical protein